MASTLIHLAVAKEVAKKLDIKRKKDYYLGTIAPDIAKQIGLDRDKTHFIINNPEDIPNIELFYQQYANFKTNAFDLGYFIHLFTDKIWFEEFIPMVKCNDSIKLLDGTTIQTTPEEMLNMIYSDYTNINIQLIDEYEMDLSLFYEPFEIPQGTIKEIPLDKLDILLNKMGILIENSKEEKPYTFDILIIKQFIEYTSNQILDELKKY